MKIKQRGMGKLQLEQRNATDSLILSYLKKHPISHVNKIIHDTGINRNSTIKTLKRLYSDKKIIKVEDSVLFSKSSDSPTNRVCYVFNFKDDEEKAVECLSRLLTIQEKEREDMTSLIRELAKNTAQLVENHHPNTIAEMRELLKIDANVEIKKSMIGKYLMRKIYSMSELPYSVKFYLAMIPREYFE